MIKLCSTIALALTSFALAFSAYSANATDSKMAMENSVKPKLERILENGILKSKTFNGVKSTFVYDGLYLKKAHRSDGSWIEYFYDRAGRLQRAVSSDATVYTPVFDGIGNLIVLQSSEGLALTLDGLVAVRRGPGAQQETEQFILKAAAKPPTGQMSLRQLAGVLAATDRWDIAPACDGDWLDPYKAPATPTTLGGEVSLACVEDEYSFVVSTNYLFTWTGGGGWAPTPGEIELCKQRVCDRAYYNNVDYCSGLPPVQAQGCHALNSQEYSRCLTDCSR